MDLQEEKDRRILRRLEDIIYDTYEDSDIQYYDKKVEEYERKYGKPYEK